MHNDRTQHLGLPLPHPQNTLQEDLPRLRESFQKLDTAAGEHMESLTALAGIVTELQEKVGDNITNLQQSVEDIDEKVGDNIEQLQQNVATMLESGTATLMGAPAVTLPSMAGVGYPLQFAVTASAHRLFTPQHFEVTVNGQDDPLIVPAVNGTGTGETSFTGAAGGTVALHVRTVDMFDNASKVTVESADIIDAYVAAPVVTGTSKGEAFANGATGVSIGPTFTIAPFAISHAGFDTPTNPEGETGRGLRVIVTNITTGTVASNTLHAIADDGAHETSVTPACPLNADVSVSFEWVCGIVTSAPFVLTFRTEAKVISPGGQALYTHESGEGVIMEYTEKGVAKALFIAGAKHRGSAAFGTYGKDVAGVTNYTAASRYIENEASQNYNTRPLPALTDAAVDTKFAETVASQTAHAICDVWMQNTSTTDTQSIRGVPAVEHCRYITTIFGFEQGLDLPTSNQLIRIFCNAEIIDALDPYAELYPHNKLGKTNPDGFWTVAGVNRAWSCLEYGSIGVRCQYSIGNSGSGYNKYGVGAVLPVTEIL